MTGLFYVYEHWRLDTNTCFYVGKGKGNRAYIMNTRNNHHKSIQKKMFEQGFGIDVKIFAFGLEEQEAFDIEIERIAFWRSKNIKLANKTDGGEGTSGITAWNKKSLTCLNDGKKFESAQDAASFYDISLSCVTQACNGRERYSKGLYFVWGHEDLNENERKEKIISIELTHAKRRKRVKKNKNYNEIIEGKDSLGRSAAGPLKNSRPVYCLTDEKIFSSASSAARFYNVSKSSIVELCLGKNSRISAGGHKFEYVRTA